MLKPLTLQCSCSKEFYKLTGIQIHFTIPVIESFILQLQARGPEILPKKSSSNIFSGEFYSFLEKCFSRSLLGVCFWFSQLFRWSVSDSYLGPQKSKFFFTKNYTITKVSTIHVFVYKFLSINDYCEISFAGILLFWNGKLNSFNNIQKIKKIKNIK